MPSTYSYRGGSYPTRYGGGWSGYSYYWGAPMWYYYTPFHPAFYYNAPYYDNGYMVPGGFSFFHLFLSLFIFIALFWVIVRLFSGGRRKVRYTTYN